MKKYIIIAAVIIAALAFGVTSCKKDEKKCWKVTLSATFEGEPDSLTVHIWCTEAECDSEIAGVKEAAKSAGATDFKAEKEEASKYTTQSDCDAQNTSENKGSVNWEFIWNEFFKLV